MPRYSVITTFLGQTKDRFHVYNEPRSLEEKFEATQKLQGYEAVEIVYPYEVESASKTKELLAKYSLSVSAVNVNVKGEPEFRDGGLTSPDKGIREKAVSFIKEAKDYAHEIGASQVTCCPLGDGFEFVFQSDYLKEWNHLVETFGESGSYRPEIPLFIEYKPKETRRVTYLPRAADVLLLLNEIGNTSMGVTLDYGHSVYAGEHPAMALSLCEKSPYPYYIHINDNDRTWDWDFFCGSHTILEYMEFVYYLRKFGYDGYLTSDTQPTRFNMSEMFAANVRLTEKIWNTIEEIGDAEFEKAISDRDYMNTWKFIEEKLLRM